ncbi:MAG TPA: SOS response-associated peptidase family protein [Microbacteriaceae bacterium]|nr:SOS response-associated peptidase family protein [Microbacteriaceae bacterium]
MCASYGLDPRFDAERYREAVEEDSLRRLRERAVANAGATIRPTGRVQRNLNPLLVAGESGAALADGWWGFLVDGAPSRFPSINTRSERLRERPAGMRRRAIVPATSWFELRKGDRRWFEFADRGELLGLAAVVQTGRLGGDDTEHLCYSIVMQPASPVVAAVHDRMPVLVTPDRVGDWLAPEPASPALLDSVIADGRALGAAIAGTERSTSPLAG